jgi:cytoskeletal protein RodZ
MNGDPRDPLDDAIAHDLGSLAPDDIDPDAVLGSMRPALHRARRRRRLAISSTVVGSLVVVLGLGALVTGPGTNDQVDVQGNPTTLPSTSTPTTRQPTTTTTSTPGTTPTTPSTPTTDDGPGTSQPGPDSTTKPPPAAPVTKTYTAIGGRVTVTLANGALTLDSYPPTAGYQAEVHNQDPDDVEVRFSNGDNESRIRVRVQNGTMQPEIDES